MTQYVQVTPGAYAGLRIVPATGTTHTTLAQSIVSAGTLTGDIDTSRILTDEELSPENLELRKKGLALVERIEHLVETNEEFHQWVQSGFDQAEDGQLFAFDKRD